LSRAVNRDGDPALVTTIGTRSSRTTSIIRSTTPSSPHGRTSTSGTLTAKDRTVSARSARISSRSSSDSIPPEPITPSAPASETAAASAWRPTQVMPPWRIG
jgi:hypothetical protein